MPRKVRILVPDVILEPTGPLRDEAVLLDGGRIRARGDWRTLARADPGAAVERLERGALMAGTVNAHSHSFQSALRGVGADGPFEEWRALLYRVTPALTEEDIHASALHAFAEMALAGVTTVVDFFYLHHGSNAGALAVVEAARQIGLRLVVARSMYDDPRAPAAFRETVELAVENAQQLAARLQGNELATVIPAPHSPHGASAAMVDAGSRIAREWGTPWHMHVAESRTEDQFTRARYGTSPLAWLRDRRALDERLRIVHGVHVSADEIGALAAAGTGLIHCPSANLALGDGICPVSRYGSAGVSVSLGCDSASSAGQLTIFGEMRLAALLQKGLAMAADATTAGSVLSMGTASGAYATGLAVGMLTIGSLADLVVLDLDDLSLQPAHDLLSSVVYSMRPTAVRRVLVNGEDIVRDGRLVHVSPAMINAGIANVRERHFAPPAGDHAS